MEFLELPKGALRFDSNRTRFLKEHLGGFFGLPQQPDLLDGGSPSKSPLSCSPEGEISLKQGLI